MLYEIHVFYVKRCQNPFHIIKIPVHTTYTSIYQLFCEIIVSSRGMDYIGQLVEHEPKQILLWSYCSENNM